MSRRTAAARWRALVRARLAQLAELGGTGPADPDFWDARAPRFARATGTGEGDPFYKHVARSVGRATTVVDVGAGAGRFALPLARRAGTVICVDPSGGMLTLLAREARRRSLRNVRPIQGRWQDVDDVRADVAICSYVLPFIEEPVAFLRKLDEAATRRVLLYLPAGGFDLILEPFWRHFHGRPRLPLPNYLDAIAVLREIGIDADVRVVEAPVRARFRDVRAAADNYADMLLLGDDRAARRELRRLLSEWLVQDRGMLRPPLRTLPAAIVGWSPTSPRGRRPGG